MLASLKRREMTPGAWFLVACDGKFTEEDLNKEGNAFATTYYGVDGNISEEPDSYLSDYETVFDACEDLYGVPDTWDAFDRLKLVLDQRFDHWKSLQLKG